MATPPGDDKLPATDAIASAGTSPSTSPDTSPAKFGTFLGVYLPSVLTILGVMMYLRFGWVVGNAGVSLSLLIVLMASGITLITGLSASAIATNMNVGVGGEYYMISRSLGLELGGAIGIPLFLCRTLSLTLYAFGLAESIAFLWPTGWGVAPVTWIAAGTIVLITAIAGKSAELSLKLQVPILITVGLSVLALLIGVATGGFAEPEMQPHYERSAPGGFWFVFAVFFPAVTGFTAGIGMSGDLKDPKRSIPKGTVLAVVTGALTYLTILGFLAISGRVSGEELAHIDPAAPPIWTRIALLGPWLVFPGMWGAILSSAFGSALGGPRVLQALAGDGLAPRFLARMSRTGQPTIGTWVTGAIALVAVALGDLNAVGRWVTIFFLTLYVTINGSAALESLVRDPSYRPTIRIPWWVSLAGSLAAIVVMFLISPGACFAAIGLEILLYSGLRRRAFGASWGDVRAGMWAEIARVALLRLRGRTSRARNWRPNILLFTANPSSRTGLCRLANEFNQGRGITTVCQFIEGTLADVDVDVAERRREIDEALAADGLSAFAEVVVGPDFESGVVTTAQTNGVSGLESNTVLFGWPNGTEGLVRVLRIARAVSRRHISTLLARLPEATGPLEREAIDVWWRGKQHNGDLMLLLAHLLSLNPSWRRARIAVRAIVEDEADRGPMEQRLRHLLEEARINAEAHVLIKPPDRGVPELMHEASRKADLVFLGTAIPARGEELQVAERLKTLAAGFHTTVFVHNAGLFAGELIE